MQSAVEKSHVSLRRFLLIHKNFLYDLYRKNSVWCRRRLSRASKAELRTLIRFLVCLEQGHVEFRAKNYHALRKGKRLNKLIELRTKKDYYLKKAGHVEKLKMLNQFASMYRYLLEPLFYDRKIKAVRD